MISKITWAVIKSQALSLLKSAAEICKKYWQVLVGALGAILFFVLRDSRRSKKSLEKVRQSSLEERDRSLQIENEKDEKVNDAIDEFQKEIDTASKDLKTRIEESESKKDEIVDNLLEEEEKKRGTISSEISEVLDKI